MLKRLSDTIKGKAKLSDKRSSKWPFIRKAHLLVRPTCAVCGGTEKLEVHHIKPFHLAPELELDPNNLITLCESKKNGVTCHQFFGHLGNYRRVNPNVREDAAIWNAKLKNSQDI